ncbi:MAG TPA: DUF3857 domain-containing protein [Kofleriaceae bacterium]|jgi:predicted Zn-dependent protease
MRPWGIAVALVGLCAVAEAGPLDKPHFTASPAELRAEARAVPKSDDDVVVLENDVDLTFEADGRESIRCHRIFLVRTQPGADDWEQLAMDYRPSIDDVPTFRARAIAPSGTVTQLDPSTFASKPEVDGGEQIEASVKLPAMAIGTIIEQEVALHARGPRLHGAGSDRFSLGMGAPVRHSRYTVTGPPSTHVAVLNLPGAPAIRATPHGATTTWELVMGPLAVRAEHETSVPDDYDPQPVIAASVATSWATVASAYAALVDARIAAGPPAEILTGATVAQVTAWFHAHVKDNDVALASAAVTPATPADTIRAGSGDAPARAIALVGLLRAAGIRADVGLLSRTPGQDVDAKFPSIDEFDYLVVRARVDGADVWIDPAERYMPAGSLSISAQNREVLVAAHETTALAKLPRSTGDVRDVRTFSFTESGEARYRGTQTAPPGIAESALRSWYGEQGHAKAEEIIAKELANRFHVTGIAVTAPDPADFASPFVLAAEGVLPSLSARREVAVSLSLGATTWQLPGALDDEDAPRRTPFRWRADHVYEVENRLVMPPGFSPPPLVAHETRDVGTMQLEIDRHVDRDTIVVRYLLHSGKATLTPDEVMTTRAAVKKLREEPDERVAAEITAWQLWHGGKALEAVAEAKRMIALHPKEARHWDTLSEIYAEAGMGLAARRAAKQAIALEPKSAKAHIIMARMWNRNLVGILAAGEPDTDRAAVIAEYRKAVALDPDDDDALAGLALTLGHELADGDRAAMREAAALEGRAFAIAENSERANARVHFLLWSGQYAEAEAAARAMDASEKGRDNLIVAAVGARDPSAAPAAAAALADESKRNTLLRDAGRELVSGRLYDEGRAVFLPAVDAATDPRAIELMKHLKPVDVAKLDPKDPRTVAERVLIYECGLDVPGAPPWDADVALEVKQMRDEAAAALVGFRSIAKPVAIDSLIASMTFTVDGDAASGWRIPYEGFGAKTSVYVVAQRGLPRIVGQAEHPTGAGVWIGSLLAKGDTADALRWLDGVATDLARLRGHSKLLADKWKKERDAGVPTKETLALYAALLTYQRPPASTVPVFQRCATTDPDLLDACAWNLSTALHLLGRDAEAADATRVLVDRHPDNARYLVARADMLVRAGHAGDAAALLDAALAKAPSDTSLMHARAFVEVDRHDVAAAEQWLDKIAARTGATPSDLNEAAWTHVVYDPDVEAARRIATPGLTSATRLESRMWNTIGGIEAFSDHPGAAIEAVRKSFASPTEPRAADWFVIGRIAESYGLREDAIAAYRRVGPPPPHTTRDGERRMSEIVQRHLVALGAR